LSFKILERVDSTYIMKPKKTARILDIALLFSIAVYLLGKTEIGQSNMDDPLVLPDLWLTTLFTVSAHILVWYKRWTKSNDK